MDVSPYIYQTVLKLVGGCLPALQLFGVGRGEQIKILRSQFSPFYVGRGGKRNRILLLYFTAINFNTREVSNCIEINPSHGWALEPL